MSNIRTAQRSFNGGEVTTEFFGRYDDPKYQSGAALMRNFIPLPHGPAYNRQGTVFVRETKDSSKKSRLITFKFSASQAFAVEMGEGYFRFHQNAATLFLSGTPTAWSGATNYVIGDLVSIAGVNYYAKVAHSGVSPPSASFWYPLTDVGANTIYEIPNGYAEADLFQVKYEQNSDVMTFTHKLYPPMELRRLGATNWTFTPESFAATLAGPATATATPTGGTTDPVDTYTYKVTAISADRQESVPTATSTTAAKNLSNAGAKIDITWTAVSGAVAYNVYKSTSTGSFGFIGQTETNSFVDSNIEEDLSRTPPVTSSPFASDYPGAVSYFEQRKIFAATALKPANFWATRTGTESNLASSIPARDDDAIALKIAAREFIEIRHIVPLNNLVFLTSAMEVRVPSETFTPTTVTLRPQSYIGASHVRPVIVNNNVLFAAEFGGSLREFAYSFQINGYLTGDVGLRAPHLFQEFTIVDMAYSKSPYPIVWVVSSNGKLLGLTYVPEQQVGAWHQHDTDGLFESVTVIPEDGEELAYFIVKRTIDGDVVRYVECFHTRRFTLLEDCFFVDCGLTYEGAAADTISNLDHLEGKTVSILAEGSVHPPQVVVGGEITLEREYTKVHIGLPYSSELKTLPLAFEVQGFGQGRKKNPSKLHLRVHKSSGIFAGPDDQKLVSIPHRYFESPGSPPALRTEEVSVDLPGNWNPDGAVIIKQTDPLPLTLLSMSLEVAIGA